MQNHPPQTLHGRPTPTAVVPAAGLWSSQNAIPAAPRSAARWSVRLLGGAGVWRGDGVPMQIADRSVAVLLARLAMSPRGCLGREELAESLWPGAAAEIGRARLRRALSRLRGMLQAPGGCGALVLTADRHTLRLDGDAIDCDVVAFERAIHAGAVAEALSLYRGDLLPGCYDEWVVAERMRLSGLAERLPLPSAWPPPTPTNIAMRVPPPSRLPLALSAFFGRHGESTHLLALIADRRCVTVTGTFGCGKSRLVAETARRSRVFETSVWVPLGDVTDGARLAEHVLAALRQPAVTASTSALDDLVTVLDRWRVLLVLDDAEQLVETGGADSVLALLDALPLAHVVITSRRALRVEGEHVVSLQALPVVFDATATDSAAAVLGHAAAALFVDRARNVLGRFDLDPDNCADVLALVRSLDGLPLAIEIAASRLRTWSVRALRLQCADGWAGLARAGARATVAPRHASMHAAIDVSWRLLAPRLRAVLAAMAERAGPWSADEVQTLVAPDGDAHAVLDALVADSVLQRRSAGAAGHGFALQGVLRAFIRSEYPRFEGRSTTVERR